MRVWTPSQTHVSSPQIDSTSYWLELEVDQMVKVGQMAKSVFTHTDTPSRTILPHKIVGRLGVLRVEFLSKNPSISSSSTGRLQQEGILCRCCRVALLTSELIQGDVEEACPWTMLPQCVTTTSCVS